MAASACRCWCSAFFTANTSDAVSRKSSLVAPSKSSHVPFCYKNSRWLSVVLLSIERVLVFIWPAADQPYSLRTEVAYTVISRHATLYSIGNLMRCSHHQDMGYYPSFVTRKFGNLLSFAT